MMLAVSAKWCHQCGSEFVARVETCPDCGLDLLPDPPGSSEVDAVAASPADRADGEPGPGDQIIYPLHEWSDEARVHLERLMQGRAHVWQGTDLVVPFEEQERAEAIIDQVELAMVVALDVDAPKLAYDLSDLTDGQLDEISGALLTESLPHGYDEETGELVVHETDEEKVEALLDAVDFPDALPVDEDDGEQDVDPLAAQQAMSDLFVAADRLRKNARDPDGVLGLTAAAEVVDRLTVPYGFTEADWKVIVDRADATVALLDADDTEDETIEEAADLLRSLLRQYV